MKTPRKYYVLALLEGLGVLGAELMGGKLLSPIYGSSLFIWTTVIGITLLCLAVGYWAGGVLAAKAIAHQKPTSTYLLLMFSFAGIAIGWMPSGMETFQSWFSGWGMFLGCGISTLLLLGPPLVLLGATTPLLIQALTQHTGQSGKVSGNIYALSTLGGIIASYTLGFWIIPAYGLTGPLIVLSALLVGAANLLLTAPHIWQRGVPVGIWLLAIGIQWPLGAEKERGQEVIYQAEGILGQIKVMDGPALGQEVMARKMLVNGIPQTDIVRGDAESRSFFKYVHHISALSSMKPAGSSALVCGLGGGSLVVEFEKLGFQVTAVDIDERQFALARKYFYLDGGSMDFHADDARHFIRQVKKPFDIIVMDLLVAESQPNHLFTLEAFADIRRALKPDGLLLMNFQGQWEGKQGRAARSIFHTLKAAGYHPHLLPSTEQEVGDLIFLASPSPINFDQLAARRINACCVETAQSHLIAQNPQAFFIHEVDTTNTSILTDDRPMLDMLRMETIISFRKNKLKGKEPAK